MHLLDTFVRMQEALGGRVIPLSDAASVGDRILALAEAHGWERVAVDPELPPQHATALREALGKRLMPLERGEPLPLHVHRADAGITWTPWGIAETGTVVEFATHDLTRYLSTLPPVHLALLPLSGLVARPQDLAGEIRRKLQTHDRACITFISGPSRTADIEMQLILGVHGPRQTYTFILP